MSSESPIDMFKYGQLVATVETLEKKKAKLPFIVRCLIYSYLDLMFLINYVTKLCKQERDKLP